MTKHRKVCTSSAKIKGNRMTLKGSCPVKSGGTKVKVIRTKARKTKHTEVPASCKGLKKRARKACAKKVCSQRPSEYRKECLKKAGLRT